MAPLKALSSLNQTYWQIQTDWQQWRTLSTSVARQHSKTSQTPTTTRMITKYITPRSWTRSISRWHRPKPSSRQSRSPVERTATWERTGQCRSQIILRLWIITGRWVRGLRMRCLGSWMKSNPYQKCFLDSWGKIKWGSLSSENYFKKKLATWPCLQAQSGLRTTHRHCSKLTNKMTWTKPISVTSWPTPRAKLNNSI